MDTNIPSDFTAPALFSSIPPDDWTFFNHGAPGNLVVFIQRGVRSVLPRRDGCPLACWATPSSRRASAASAEPWPAAGVTWA